MTVAVKNRTRIDRILSTKEREAWAEYLKTCRGTSQVAYEEVEEWAWARLAEKLRIIAKRRTDAERAVA